MQEDFRRWKTARVCLFVCVSALGESEAPATRMQPPPTNTRTQTNSPSATPSASAATPLCATPPTHPPHTNTHTHTRKPTQNQQPERHAFSFCRHPFVYDPAAKARVLALENQLAQLRHFEGGVMQARRGVCLVASCCVLLVLRPRLFWGGARPPTPLEP